MLSLLALTLMSPSAVASPAADAQPSTAWVAPVQTSDARVLVSLELVGDTLQYQVTTQGEAPVERAFVRTHADAEAPLLVLEPGARGLRGSATADALRGPLADDSLADLARLLDSGEAVVTVNVEGLPAGSVLARIEPLGQRDQRQAALDE